MITTTLRIDQITYEELMKQAIKEDRSINSEIKFMIKWYLETIRWYKK